MHLAFNINKLQSIIIDYKLRSPSSDIKLKYGSDHISTSEEMKYLGVLIVHKLHFLPQIKNL